MSVEVSQAGARILRVLEAIAGQQPIGVRAVARFLGEDKSAVHRALMTLAREGWIVSSGGTRPLWKVSPRLAAIMGAAGTFPDLKRRARPALQGLRDRCGETVVLIVLEAERLIVADVFESPQALRWVPPVGTQAEPKRTAAGRAIVPFLPPVRQSVVLAAPPSAELIEMYRRIRELGYSTSDRETSPYSASVGAPVFAADGTACAAVTIVGPSERINAAGWPELGRLAMDTAKALSI